MNDPLTELRAKLNALWLERGRPSSRYIAHSSETVGNGGSISHSTASSVLRCTRLPTWLSLRSVVDVLSGDSKLFQALWKEAAKQQDAMTTSGSAVRVDEGTVAEYDFIIPLKPWLTQLERMEGLPEAVLRFDRAALQSPPFSVISSLLSSALPLPIGVTTTFRPRLIRISTELDFWSLLIVDLAFRRGESGPRQWLIAETDNILRREKGTAKEGIYSVWNCLFMRHLSGDDAQPDLFDDLFGEIIVAANNDHNKFFRLADFLLSIVREDVACCERLVALLVQFEEAHHVSTRPDFLERVKHLIGKTSALVQHGHGTVPPFRPRFVSIETGALCGYGFHVMQNPLTVADVTSILGKRRDDEGGRSSLPYVFDSLDGAMGSAEVLNHVASQVMAVLSICSEREEDSDWLWDLPTVNEWISLAGCEERPFPWGAEPPDTTRANLAFPGRVVKLRPVGLYHEGRSRHGAYDCCGNVHELVRVSRSNQFRRAFRLAGGCFTTRPNFAECWNFRSFAPRSGPDSRRNVGLRLIRYPRAAALGRWKDLDRFLATKGGVNIGARDRS